MSENEVAELVSSLSMSHARMVKVGMEHAQERIRPALQCLQREFQNATLDPVAKIPTALQMAILNALSLLPDYAETMVKAS